MYKVFSQLSFIPMAAHKISLLLFIVLATNNVSTLQRPPPRYSQQYMPQTSFTCRNKIVGSYYADPETDCQLFHVCVSVAGNVQDYRFICPNDTAFDQESQTCADWYDVDCEAATLYYASDNFDLYRIGSGLESVHYDSIRGDFEPQDHLQRSESNDPIRSSLNPHKSNNLKKLSTSKEKNYSISDNLYPIKHENKIVNKFGKESMSGENQKTKNIGQIIIGKQTFTNNIDISPKIDTISAVRKDNNGRLLSLNDTYMTFNHQIVHKTNIKPQSFDSVISTSSVINYATTTTKSTTSLPYRVTHHFKTTQSNAIDNLNQFDEFEISTKQSNTQNRRYQDSSKIYQNKLLTTSKSYLSDFENMQNNNNEKRNLLVPNYSIKLMSDNINNSRSSSIPELKSSITLLKPYDNYRKEDLGIYSHIPKKINEYSNTIVVPKIHDSTTHNPLKKKKNNGLNNEKFISVSPYLIDYNATKLPKKLTHPIMYQSYETTVKTFEFNKSSTGFGFSPSSVNHLAETFRTTLFEPRLLTSSSSLAEDNNEAVKIRNSKKVNTESKYYHSQLNYSTTLKVESSTVPSTIVKKNDYDYAYYDNGPLEYENIEVEHVNNSNESVKIK